MAKMKSAPRPRRSWRNHDDRNHRSFPSWPSPESLRPGMQTVIAAANGNPEAEAIADAYRCHLPVVTMTKYEMEVLA